MDSKPPERDQGKDEADGEFGIDLGPKRSVTQEEDQRPAAPPAAVRPAAKTLTQRLADAAADRDAADADAADAAAAEPPASDE